MSAQGFHGRQANRSQVMIERLEDRQLLSASPASVCATSGATRAVTPAVSAALKHPTVRSTKAVVTVSTSKATKPAVKAVLPTAIVRFPWTPYTINGKTMLGTWTGSMRADGEKTSSPMSVTFTMQNGKAATGTFYFGSQMQNATVLSTLVFNLNGNFCMVISTSTMYGGLVGAVMLDGNTMLGHWSISTSSGWKTGFFTMQRN